FNSGRWPIGPRRRMAAGAPPRTVPCRKSCPQMPDCPGGRDRSVAWGVRAQARKVCGEQPKAGRVPAWVGSSRLGEHRSEHDDVVRGYVACDGAVSPPAVDDLLDYLVDVLADDAGPLPCRGRSAVQRQDELVALVDRRVDELPERLGGGRAVAFGRFGVGQHLLERSMGEVAEQVLAGGEVTVERADADSRVGRDRGHRDERAFTVYRRVGSLDEGLVIAGRVAARL